MCKENFRLKASEFQNQLHGMHNNFRFMFCSFPFVSACCVSNTNWRSNMVLSVYHIVHIYRASPKYVAVVESEKTYFISSMRNNRDALLLCYCNMFYMGEMFGVSLLNAGQQQEAIAIRRKYGMRHNIQPLIFGSTFRMGLCGAKCKAIKGFSELLLSTKK